MAVLKAKAEKFVPLFLTLLDRDLVTPLIVTTMGRDNFVGAKNDVVNMRVNGLRAKARKYEFRTRTNPIVMDDIQGEGSIAVKLDTHITSATGLTLEHTTLDEIDFTREVLQPQVTSVVEQIEADVLYGLEHAPFADTFSVNAGADPHRVGLEAMRLLDAHKVAPKEGRFFLIGTGVAAAWLATDRLANYDLNGQVGTPAFRNAVIGQIAGSPVVVNNSVAPDFAYYGHKSALVLGNVAPVVPMGAVQGRSGISQRGIAVTWIQDYDAPYARDRSIVHSFSGITSVNDERKANGDLLDPTDPLYGQRNVRGLRFTVTGTGTVLRDEDVAA